MKRTVISLAAAALALTLGAAVRADDTTPAAAAPAAAAQANPAPASEAKPMHHARHKGTAAAAIDVNSATKEQLMTLPGVDDATAEKIIAGRPFVSRYDLVKKSIVSKEAYSKIKSKISAKKAS
jgi:DNA uptake protein ComE-like DNA-binding protein